MKFIPLYERVLVQVLEGIREVGEGEDRFVLPDNAKEDYLIGSVISAGDGYRKENGQMSPMLVKEGMTVVFGPHAGTKVQISGQQYLSMREGEILGWLEQDEVFEPAKIANNAVLVEPGIVEIG